ncbi:Uncharacterized protein FKW44_008417, partial [Caligus rogercresseyi]
LMKYLMYVGWPDIIVLTDTRTTIKGFHGIPTSYEVFEAYSSSSKRGVAILVKDIFKPKLVLANNSGNLCYVQIRRGCSVIDILGTYGPNEDNPNFYACELLPLIGSKSTIIIGDLNL